MSPAPERVFGSKLTSEVGVEAVLVAAEALFWAAPDDGFRRRWSTLCDEDRELYLGMAETVLTALEDANYFVVQP